MFVDYLVENVLELFRHFACCSRVEVVFQESIRLVDFAEWVEQLPSLNNSLNLDLLNLEVLITFRRVQIVWTSSLINVNSFRSIALT